MKAEDTRLRLPPGKVKDLVARALRGEGEAFQDLFTSAERLLYRTGLGLTGDPQMAEEALAETALSVLESLQSLRRPEYFYTWATRIMINKCYAAIRLQGKVIPIEGERPSPGGDFPGDQQWADYQDVRSALSQLNEDHRTVVVLRYLEDMSTAEVGDILGIPQGTVKSRLHYALREIRSKVRVPSPGVGAGGVSNE